MDTIEEKTAEEKEVKEVVQACPYASRSACELLRRSKEDPSLNYELPEVLSKDSFRQTVGTASVVGGNKTTTEKKATSNKALLIGGGVILVVLVAVGVFFYLKKR